MIRHQIELKIIVTCESEQEIDIELKRHLIRHVVEGVANNLLMAMKLPSYIKALRRVAGKACSVEMFVNSR